ncbi:MAG: Glu-tRNA(Gln) amidotransferase subunit GatE [Candidatus Nanohaloarchaea archaeon]
MSDKDYEELGFRCGIEIHQQLDTETKLFCECPVDLEDENPDAEVERYLRAVAGETGEKDVAAEYEARKSKRFVYKYYSRNNCLVELDEEPPHEMDSEALNTALTFARMVDAEVPEEIQVMRKMVVDGSNTSGFQRTAMVGLDGEIETETGTVKIEDIELEEESAGIHTRDEEKAVYDLNRLGVPLIEVGTDASIENPEHAREVAMKLGMLMRSTRKARRGIGTIRQDVNVSIEDGARVEIKGFQDVKNIDRLIELEVERQKNLVELGEELKGGLAEKLLDRIKDRDLVEKEEVTELFRDTDNHIVSTVIENNGKVYALKLPRMSGKMKRKISGERYVAKELVDYAKSRGVQGILHTDEDLESYELESEFERLREKFDAGEEDVVAVIAAEEENAGEAAEAVRKRAEMLYSGEIPEETRNAEQNFTTSYSRPLPGSARMYPETDIPPIRVTEDRVNQIDENLPETLEEREEELAEEIGEELASQIVWSEHLEEFEKFRDRVETKLAANIFVNTYPRLEGEGVPVENLEEHHLGALFDALANEKMAKGDIDNVLTAMAEEPGREPLEIIESTVEEKSSEDEIRAAVREVLDEKSELVEEQGMHAQGALMGVVMSRIEADGDTVSGILQEELEERVD